MAFKRKGNRRFLFPGRKKRLQNPQRRGKRDRSLRESLHEGEKKGKTAHSVRKKGLIAVGVKKKQPRVKGYKED